MKESFTNGHLITLSLSGNREAITEVCGLLAERTYGLLETRFIKGVKLIGQGISPDDAFDWRYKQLRQEIKKEAMDILKTLSTADFHNDQDLFIVAITFLKKLRTGRSPNESFGWNQARRGRRVNSTIACRNWDIRMTVHTLMRDLGVNLSKACELVSLSLPGEEDHYKTIEAIARYVNAYECPQFPENPFPLPADRSLAIDIDKLQINIDCYKQLIKK